MVKARVLEDLANREAEAAALREASGRLSATLATSESQRRVLLQKVERLEQALAGAAAREAALHGRQALEASKAGEELRQEMRRVSGLQASLQKEMRLRAEAEAAEAQAEARTAAAEVGLNAAVEAMARKLARAEEDHGRVQADSASRISMLEMELQAANDRADAGADELVALEHEVLRLQQELAEGLRTRQELEHQLADCLFIQSSRATEAGSEVLVKQLRLKLASMTEEVKGARSLKEQWSNAELLREKVESEKQRAQRAEAALEELGEHQQRAKRLEAELLKWEEAAGRIPGVLGREDLLSRFSELQKEMIGAVAKHGELSAEIVQLRTALVIAEDAYRPSEYTRFFVPSLSLHIVAMYSSSNSLNDSYAKHEAQL
eukprot:SM000015S01190  [mRNA]  locus=s15:352668:355258:+ [translate_table: standard]